VTKSSPRQEAESRKEEEWRRKVPSTKGRARWIEPLRRRQSGHKAERGTGREQKAESRRESRQRVGRGKGETERIGAARIAESQRGT